MTTTQHTKAQLTLPGQSHTAEGPHDHTGMYVMHFGFRRDLANLASAVANTPLGDTSTWSALQVRWQLFADILHHHHAAEDDYYWPALSAAVQLRGTADDQRLDHRVDVVARRLQRRHQIRAELPGRVLAVEGRRS